MWISWLLVACTTEPEPVEPRPVPQARVAPETEALPQATPLQIDLSTAEPMKLATKGPGGEPSETLSLVFASRGDGEIEPCG